MKKKTNTLSEGNDNFLTVFFDKTEQNKAKYFSDKFKK